MNLTRDLARRLTEAADYLVPCPHSSFLGIADTEPEIRRPAVLRARRTNRFIFSRCSAACALCTAFIAQPGAMWAAAPETIARGWNAFVAGVAASAPQAREAITLRRMDGAGLLPAGFMRHDEGEGTTGGAA